LVWTGESVFWKVFLIFFPEGSILSVDPFSQGRYSFLMLPTEGCPPRKFFSVVRSEKNEKGGKDHG
jgi:hypothetical protein